MPRSSDLSYPRAGANFVMLGPQPFGEVGSPSRRTEVKVSHAVAWSGCGAATPTPIDRAAYSRAGVEAYNLLPTRFENIAEWSCAEGS